MSDVLAFYKPVDPTTWVYLASLLMIGLYFKFSRSWSLRNLDLIGLILLAPGLLLVEYGRQVIEQGNAEAAARYEQLGYLWLFTVGGLFMVRLLVDPIMVRRPLLEPNLSLGGMTFLGAALLMFLMVNVLTCPVEPEDLAGASEAERIIAGRDGAAVDSFAQHGPGYPLLFVLPRVTTQTLFADKDDSESATPRTAEQDESRVNVATSRLLAILCHLAIVAGIIVVGFRHFDNYKTGIAAATLYLMLPYTAQKTGMVYHALPAALLVWVLVSYRRPLVAGMLMGLAIGTSYYPVFLLPLWIGFYWRRGVVRFTLGVAVALVILVGVLGILAIRAGDFDQFVAHLQQMFGFTMPTLDNLEGFWQPTLNEPAYRIPVIAAFVALAGSLAIWPAQKNLGTLMSCSAAVMLGTQFWHAHGGGLYMAWYLPPLLLTVFRPNLEDRVALLVLNEGWWPIQWRPRTANVKTAA